MIVCKGDMKLGSGCGKCARCKDQIKPKQMKPLITKDSEGRYWCTIPDEKYPDGDDATVEEWFAYMSCGCGDSPIEAYRDWLEDCRRSLEVYENKGV